MKSFKYILISICVLFLTQIVAFNFIGRHTIKNELLPSSFVIESHLSDTVYVTDSEIFRCNSGSDIQSAKLELNENDLKEKLKAKYIYFENFKFNEKGKKKNRKNYLTSTRYTVYSMTGNWKTLYNFFEFVVTETLVAKSNFNFRRCSYKWVLFTWVKTYEKSHQ
jgi:hypothetical protein